MRPDTLPDPPDGAAWEWNEELGAWQLYWLHGHARPEG